MSLSILLHGQPGHGKTTTAMSAPGPVLYIDGENSAEHLNIRRDGEVSYPDLVIWKNPAASVPTVEEGEVCVMPFSDISTVRELFKVLERGEHPFRSIIVDSLTEINDCVKAEIRSEKAQEYGYDSSKAFGMEFADWNRTAGVLTDLMRSARDGSKGQVECVAVITHSGPEMSIDSIAIDGKQAKKKMMAIFDVIGACYKDRDDEGEVAVNMAIQPVKEGLLAKCRPELLAARYPQGGIRNPDLTELVNVLKTSERNIRIG